MSVRVTIDHAALAELLRAPEAKGVVQDAGAQFAAVARAYAAHRTGAGAASIKGTIVTTADGIESDVSWDAAHRYMFFQEVGTTYMPAHPALGPALDQYAQF